MILGTYNVNGVNDWIGILLNAGSNIQRFPGELNLAGLKINNSVMLFFTQIS